MTIEFDPLEDFIVVVGMKKYGKTVLTKWLIKIGCKTFVVIDIAHVLGDLGYIIHYPERLEKALSEGVSQIVYQPVKGTKEHWHKVFGILKNYGSYTLVIDEIQEFCYGKWYVSDNLRSIVTRGRNQKIGLICNSRRPHLFHKDIRGNADLIFCFYLHEKSDVKYMAEWFDIEEQEIKDLEKYHSILFKVGASKGEKIERLEPCPQV